MKEISLIKSVYSKEESFELIYELLDAKIFSLNKVILSRMERGLPLDHFELRKSQLVQIRTALQLDFTALPDKDFEVECTIKIKKA